MYLPSTTRAAAAVLICLISVATLNYVRPHKNKYLFLVCEGAFFLTAGKYLTTIFSAALGRNVQRSADDVALAYFLIVFDLLVLVGGVVSIIFIVCMLKVDIHNLHASGAIDADYDEDQEYILDKIRKLSKRSGNKKQMKLMTSNTFAQQMVSHKIQKRRSSSWDSLSLGVIKAAVHCNIADQTEQEASQAKATHAARTIMKKRVAHERMGKRLQERLEKKAAAKEQAANKVVEPVRNTVDEAAMPDADKRLRHFLFNAGEAKCKELLQRAALSDVTLLDRNNIKQLLKKFQIESDDFFQRVCKSERGPIEQKLIMQWVFAR